MNFLDFGLGFAVCFCIWWLVLIIKDPKFKIAMHKIIYGEDP